MLAWLAVFLSWGSLGLETATVVVSSPTGRGLHGILSESDCEASNCWLRRRDGRYRNPAPRGTPKLPVFVCGFCAHCAKA